MIYLYVFLAIRTLWPFLNLLLVTVELNHSNFYARNSEPIEQEFPQIPKKLFKLFKYVLV